MRGFTSIQIIALSCLFILSSCTPYKTIFIETYEPKKVNIPQDKTELLIIPNNILIDSNKLFNYIDGNYARDSSDILEIFIFESCIGFISTVDQSSHFKRMKPAWNKRDIWDDDEIQWAGIQKLSNDYQCDIVLTISIDQLAFSIQPYLVNSYISGSDFVHVDTLFGINEKYHVIYHLLDPVSQVILDSLTYYHHDIRKSATETPEDAEPLLSDSLEIFADLGYWNGMEYAERIAPAWSKDTRILYYSGKDEMRKAFKLAIENNWNEAMGIWESIYNKTSYSKIGGKAAYNLAVAHEITGSLWKARLWAMRSFRQYETIESSEYANLLYERMQYYKQFETE